MHRDTHTHKYTCTVISLTYQTHTDQYIIFKERQYADFKKKKKSQQSSSSAWCHTHRREHAKINRKTKHLWWRGEEHHSQFEQTYQPHTSDSLCALSLLLPTIRRCFRKFLWVAKSKRRRDNRGQRKDQNVKKRKGKRWVGRKKVRQHTKTHTLVSRIYL